MRGIGVKDIEDMTMAESDPVLANLAEEMRGILFDVAPERAEELGGTLRELKVSIVPVDLQHESPFVVVPDLGEIRAHMPALKRQLVMAHAYVIAYRGAQRDATGPLKVYLGGGRRESLARDMLGWAMLERHRVALAKGRAGVVPNETAPAHWFPMPNPPKGSDDRIAVGMFYTALAADLHHELAHLAKRHSTSDPKLAVQQEQEADEEAARWLVGDRTEDDPGFMGRMLGLVLSQTYEVFLTLEGFESDPVHPPLVRRLRSAVEPRVPNPNHAVWAFVAAILRLHLELCNRKYAYNYDPNKGHRTFRDMAEYFMGVYEGGGR